MSIVGLWLLMDHTPRLGAVTEVAVVVPAGVVVVAMMAFCWSSPLKSSSPLFIVMLGWRLAIAASAAAAAARGYGTT